LADRWRKLGELHRLEPDVILRETFTLPLQAALLQARKNFRRTSGPRHMTIVENWCQLPDGQIEFMMRRLPTVD
jgi:hypothetical protein